MHATQFFDNNKTRKVLRGAGSRFASGIKPCNTPYQIQLIVANVVSSYTGVAQQPNSNEILREYAAIIPGPSDRE